MFQRTPAWVLPRKDTPYGPIKLWLYRRMPGLQRLMDTPPVLRRAPPTLGEHTHEVLTELGLDAGRSATLKQAGIIQDKIRCCPTDWLACTP